MLFSRGVSFGGKGSTEYLVKGARKDVPQELVDELKAICQVFFTHMFFFSYRADWLNKF